MMGIKKCITVWSICFVVCLYTGCSLDAKIFHGAGYKTVSGGVLGQIEVSRLQGLKRPETAAMESERPSVEPVYFHGSEEEIREQKLLMACDNPYRKAADDYFEGFLGVGGPNNYCELFETDIKYYTEDEFQDFSDRLLKLAKNEIYARHGRRFLDEMLYEYFLTRMWYEPTYTPEEFDDSCLNDCERANLELLARLENQRNSAKASNTQKPSVEPVHFRGNCEEVLAQKMMLVKNNPYWEATRDFVEHVKGTPEIDIHDYLFRTNEVYYARKDFVNCPEVILKLAKNEIYARHGRMFLDEDLYEYFLSRVWYEPIYVPEEFDDSRLNDCERANLELLLELGA